MNLAYYVVLFDAAADALFEALGYGTEARRPAKHGPFAVETHTLYERELLAGERVRVAAQVIGADPRRLHVAYEMARATDGVRAACQEVMYLNVDLRERRAAPFTPDVRARMEGAVAAHAALPALSWVGRRVALHRR
ncbi:MAG: thioesterase family protein [Acidisphaera sp.]|nr:thioesterase family protein [Acidisphaera sp.]MBV9811937.1 thioesterase family protein [Acetobacteraceae bacterium]